VNEADELRAGALRVLDENWLGESTRPAPRLYPHQWSWDSAFIAIGNARANPERATVELQSLFRAQWSNGLVPHIVFGTTGEDYFPSASFWTSEVSDAAPTAVRTSGICQPPVHALAVGALADRLPDGGRSFVPTVFEHLVAWHEYLFENRVIVHGLAEIWHPWESGMDNSPLWDGPMAALTPRDDEIPSYVRADTRVVDAADRPTSWEYDRYAYLAAYLRDHRYTPNDPEMIPFRVHDVLFNALFARSERELVRLAELVGADSEVHADRAHTLCSAIHSNLWDESIGMHAGYDIRQGSPISIPTAGGFAAVLAAPDPATAAAVTATLSKVLEPLEDHAVLLPTVPARHPAFEASRYWRGPAWINLMWLVALGLDEVNEAETARQLRDGITGLVERSGFFEYFDPNTGAGHGSNDFSWTAALYLAVLDQ